MNITVVRQRKSIGDAVLLSPLLQGIKTRYPNSKLTVISDSIPLSGSLIDIYSMIPAVDKIINVNPFEWTTNSNIAIDPIYSISIGNPIPPEVKKADIVLDCNGQFMQFERHYHGKPPYGISEFWVRYHGYEKWVNSYLPKLTVPDIDIPIPNPDKKRIGIVIKSGESVRDWNHNHKIYDLIDSLYTQNYDIYTIDSILNLNSRYATSIVGKNIKYITKFIETLDVLITPDTGLLHIAQAVGTPTVALWGIMEPELRVKDYDTYVVPQKPLGTCDDQYCACCSWKFQQWSCLRKITIPMILDGVKRYA